MIFGVGFKKVKKYKTKGHHTKMSIADVSEMVRLQESGQYTYAGISSILNRHLSSISYRLNGLGYKCIDPSISARIYQYDEHFFDCINTPQKAYILGFLYADGAVLDNRTMSITLSDKDRRILEDIRMAMSSNIPIRDRRHKSGRRYVCFSISNIILCNGLIKHGCVGNKTEKIIFPQWLDERLYNHFIRGYFDGDGCIFVSKLNANRSFSMVGTESFLLSVRGILAKECGLNLVKILNAGKSVRVKALSFSGKNQCVKIREWLYRDADMFLTRKRNKFYSI